ncbi:MAG: Hemin uptake protein hemP [Planctomycetaceae bacterium]|nr:Hemin uptake protein hemP [Planctomycetaceae bacterium]
MKPEDSDLDPGGEQKSPSLAPQTSNSKLRELTSDELLCGQTEVCIRHGDEIYRLRVTRNGKLILHK